MCFSLPIYALPVFVVGEKPSSVVSHNFIFLDKSGPVSAPLTFQTTMIEGKAAISATELAPVYGLNFPVTLNQESLYGLEIEVYLQPDFKDRELLFFYSSYAPSVREAHQSMQSTLRLKKGEWQKMTVWLPSAGRSDKSPDLLMHLKDAVHDYTYDCSRTDERVWLRTIQEGRWKQREFFTPLQETKGMYIHSLRLLQKQAKDQVLLQQEVLKRFASFWDMEPVRHLMVGFLFFVLVSSLCLSPRRLKARIMIVFLLPVLPLMVWVYVFCERFFDQMLEHGLSQQKLEMSRAFRQFSLIEARAESQTLKNILAHVSEIKKMTLAELASPLLQEQLNQSNTVRRILDPLKDTPEKFVAWCEANLKLEPYTAAWMTDDQKRRIRNLYAETMAGFRYGLERFKMNPGAQIETHMQEWQTQALLLVALQNQLMARLWVLDQFYGIRLFISNGPLYFMQDRFGSGGRFQFTNFILRTYLPYSFNPVPMVAEEPAAIRELRNLRETMDVTLGSAGFFDEGINRPMQLNWSGINASESDRSRSFWDFFRGPKGDMFVISGSVIQSVYIRTLFEAVQESLLDPKHFYLLGEEQMEDFPLPAAGQEALVTMAADAKQQKTNLFELREDQDGFYFYYAGRLNFPESYFASIRQSAEPFLLGLKKKKNFFFGLLVYLELMLPLLGIYMAWRLEKPLSNLVRALKMVRQGELNAELKPEGDEEMSQLAMQFNRLLFSLKERVLIEKFVSREIVGDLSDSKAQQASILYIALFNLQELALRDQEVLNQFLGLVQKTITERGGLIDKFTGSAVLAIFEKEEDAFATGLQLCQAFMQRPVWKTGIGLASGDLILGSVGAKGRKDYTAIGHTVNMAARLSSLSQDLGSILILDHKTAKALKQTETKSLGEQEIRGLSRREVVYAPFSV